MKKSDKTKVAVGVGLGLAAAAAGAGFYLFGTQSGKAARKKASKWADDLKSDVVKKAKKLQKMDERAFRTIVDESSKAYERIKSINKDDLGAAAAELKSNWKHIEAEITRVAKKDTKVVKKAVTVAAKKVVKAVAKAAPKKAAAKTVAKKKA
jgi:hypothetical protein